MTVIDVVVIALLLLWYGGLIILLKKFTHMRTMKEVNWSSMMNSFIVLGLPILLALLYLLFTT